MSNRPTPLESDQSRCLPDLIEGDQIEVEGLKTDLDTFMRYRGNFDRAQMVYLSGRIIHRMTNFFSPFLCDIGVTMHHESLSDGEYMELLKSLQEAQQPQSEGDADGDADGNEE